MIVSDEEWWKGLRPREREIARLVARGLSNKEIARELGLTEGGVKGHLHSVFQKLGIRRRSDLIILAVSQGAVP